MLIIKMDIDSEQKAGGTKNNMAENSGEWPQRDGPYIGVETLALQSRVMEHHKGFS